jgi:hypothetical protein
MKGGVLKLGQKKGRWWRGRLNYAALSCGGAFFRN